MSERYSNRIAKGVFTVTAFDQEGLEVHKVVQPNLFTDLLEENLNRKYQIAGAVNPHLPLSPIAMGIFDDQSNGGVGTVSAADFKKDTGELLGYIELGYDAVTQTNPLIGKRNFGEFTSTVNPDGSITQKTVGEFSTNQGNGLINKIAILPAPHVRYLDRDTSTQFLDGTGFHRFNPKQWQAGYSPLLSHRTFATDATATSTDVALFANSLDSMESIFTTQTSLLSTTRCENMLSNNGDYLVYMNPEIDYTANISIKIGSFIRFSYLNDDVPANPVFTGQGSVAFTGAPLANLGYANDGSMCTCINATTGDLYVLHMDTAAPNTLTIHEFTEASNYATRNEHTVTTVFTYTSDYVNGLNAVVDSLDNIQVLFTEYDPTINLGSSVTSTRVERLIINSSFVKTTEEGFLTNINSRVGSIRNLSSIYYDERSDSFLCINKPRTATGDDSIYLTIGGVFLSRISIPCQETFLLGSFAGATNNSNHLRDTYTGNKFNEVPSAADDVWSWGGSSGAAYRTGNVDASYTATKLLVRLPNGDLINSNYSATAIYGHYLCNQSLNVIYMHKMFTNYGSVAIMPLPFSVAKPVLAETLISPFLNDNTLTIKVEYEVTINPLGVV